MLHAATLAIAAIVAAHAAVTLDRIAVVVENQPVKDSDIDRDIRVTAFLNGERPDLGAGARKQAASRLIDQALIRGEIELAQYPEATSAEIQGMLAQVRKRFGSQAAYTAALARDGLTDAQVADQLVISPRTVNSHLKSIYEKIQVKSRSAATRWAIDHGLL